MEALTVIFVFLGWFGLVATLLQTYSLLPAAKIPGIGRILFLSLASLKLWVALFLAYILWGTIIGGVPRELRVLINAGFALYLVVQPIAVNVALYRWRTLDYTGGSLAAGAKNYFDYLRQLANRKPGASGKAK